MRTTVIGLLLSPLIAAGGVLAALFSRHALAFIVGVATAVLVLVWAAVLSRLLTKPYDNPEFYSGSGLNYGYDGPWAQTEIALVMTALLAAPIIGTLAGFFVFEMLT